MKKRKSAIAICPLLLLGFLLGIHNGRVAIWKDGETDPWRIFPYPVAVLPTDIQAQLRQGIRIETMDDLDHFLENLLS